MDTIATLISRFDEKAAQTGLSTSTLGRLVGQGGRFYARLIEGKRVWPETAESVLEKLDQIQSPSQAPDGAVSITEASE